MLLISLSSGGKILSLVLHHLPQVPAWLVTGWPAHGGTLIGSLLSSNFPATASWDHSPDKLLVFTSLPQRSLLGESDLIDRLGQWTYFCHTAAPDVGETACRTVPASWALGQLREGARVTLSTLAARGPGKRVSGTVREFSGRQTQEGGTNTGHSERTINILYVRSSLYFCQVILFSQYGNRLHSDLLWKTSLAYKMLMLLYFLFLFFFVMHPHASVSITEGVIRRLLQFHKNRKLSTGPLLD